MIKKVMPAAKSHPANPDRSKSGNELVPGVADRFLELVVTLFMASVIIFIFIKIVFL